jgi:ATP-dependent DNA helicase RecG
LFTSSENQEDSTRLRALEETNSGIVLAEIDLKLRGSGALFGTQQSGREEYKFADLFDLELLRTAKRDAERLLAIDEDLQGYPRLRDKVMAVMKKVEAN